MTVRRAGILATALLAAGLTAPAPAIASAAPDRALRCAGHVPTVVGTKGTVHGTPGRDIIVAAGRANRILAGEGNDIVCVDSRHRAGVSVEAGAGDDQVVVRRRTVVNARLGAGDDSYLGGPGPDWVFTAMDATSGRVVHGDGQDTVSTKGGRDMVVSGVPGRTNRDRIDLGAGDDSLDMGGGVDRTRARFAGGPGRDQLSVELLTEKGTLVVDAAADAATLRGRRIASWQSFEDYRLWGGARQVFLGSDEDDGVDLYAGHTPVEVRSAGGDDRVGIEWAPETGSPAAPVLDGGEGRDVLHVGGAGDLTVASLLTGHLETTTFGETSGFDFTGFEDLGVFHDWLNGPSEGRSRIELTGDAGANHLQADACDVVLRGGPGDDHLRVGDDPERAGSVTFSPGEARCRGTSRVHGEAGDDVLVSRGLRHTRRGPVEAPYDDLLDGGEGTDTADGGLGRDTCVAESRSRCEA